GGANTTGSGNSFFGAGAGTGNHSGNKTGSNNTAIGAGAGEIVGLNQSLAGNNTFVGALTRGQDDYNANLSYATAIGAGAVASGSNGVWLGRKDQDDVYVGNYIHARLIGTGAGEDLCRDIPQSYRPFAYIGVCVSSLRYKTDVKTYTG